ncbi:MAG: helix-hairpin-helix domain-containing protein [Candidatus Solibacter usitatus]|nr:helix-hairpin-helix domain-containing protein [Candidatus Solibacter usitatus]
MRFISTLIAALLSVALLTPAQTAPKKAKEAVKAAATKAAAKADELIDINTASIEKLRSIPGIGEVYSKKIVGGRPYRAKNELVSKNILPEGVYDKVKDQIIAKQPGKKQ